MVSETSERRAVTPGSVKALMLVEAVIICFLCYWLASEYTYSSVFRTYADQVFLSHIATYSAVIGVAVGLASSVAGAMLYKNLHAAKHRVETVAVPKIIGSVERLVSTLPGTSSAPKTIAEPVASQPALPSAIPSVSTLVPDSEKPATTERKEKPN